MTGTFRFAATAVILFFVTGFAPLPNGSKQGMGSHMRNALANLRLADCSITDEAASFSTVNPAGAVLSEKAFSTALKCYNYCIDRQLLKNKHIVTIIDFSKPSTQPRLFVLNIATGKLLLQSLVAHGKNSGQKYATRFSNIEASNQSSLGLYITLNAYMGSHGYSLRLKGCEAGINDNAYSRDIVMHSADYVSTSFITANGFLGRSEGCPAVPENRHKKIIDYIKGGSCLFIYHPTPAYTKKSKLLNR
jgi:hypothetical protein